MSTEVLTAIIAAAVAIISVAIGIYGQARTTKLEHILVKQREKESKAEKAKEIIAHFRDPIIRTAIDLQSRLYGMFQLDSTQNYYNKSSSDRDYFVNNTLYVIAEYLGWVEILRIELQYLDFGDIEMNRRLSNLLDDIAEAFYIDKDDLAFRLFRGEQRAIGEIMVTTKTGNNPISHECIGYATFVQRLNDPNFSVWFDKLEKDIEKFTGNPDTHPKRLALLQHKLIDLIDFLDPEFIRYTKEHRQKVTISN